jgi:hypothetical protein
MTDYGESTASEVDLYAIEHGLVVSSRQKLYYATAQCAEAREALRRMAENPDFDTDSSSHNGALQGFIERHLHYLSLHPGISIEGYIANLKVMTSKRRR